MTTFRIEYKFGIDEVLTKINILREEFEYTQNHSPIEHVRTRLKTMESLLGKVVRTKCPLDLDSVRTNIRDIAGIRVVCAFASDVYWIAQMLSDQPDITVVEVKDYIAKPKPNGYQSLHLIVQVPVFLSDRTVHVYVELQIRTIAMDFWDGRGPRAHRSTRPRNCGPHRPSPSVGRKGGNVEEGFRRGPGSRSGRAGDCQGARTGP